MDQRRHRPPAERFRKTWAPVGGLPPAMWWYRGASLLVAYSESSRRLAPGDIYALRVAFP